MYNENCIIRLLRYKNALNRFRELGFVKIFSDNLGDTVGIAATQVRKDFSLFGIKGNRRGGYQIDVLIEKLNNIFGKDKVQKVVIVGAGNIGTALMKYQGFKKHGIEIVAAFDIDPAKYKKSYYIPVFSVDELERFVLKNKIKIGIIAVPDIIAQTVLDKMIDAGIKGVLNFAPIDLKTNNQCVIRNMNLELELENLIYLINIK